jgi:hypothetical protein
MTKTLFLLDIDNFAPEVKRLTLPFIELYAKRIGARIHTITERKYPDWPVTYEKLQIYDWAREIGSDWNLFLDLDALIHPECPDYTIYLPMGTVAFHSADLAHTRFGTDDYMLRDGRYLAPGNWFTIASRLCVDLWRPLEMKPKEAVERIHPTAHEIASGITPGHLVDDFALTENIARFGLAVKTLKEIQKERGMMLDVHGSDGKLYRSDEFLFHQYTMPAAVKAEAIRKRIEEWNVKHYF